MTIRAKFAGFCKSCHHRINAGDEIEWKKGEPTRHAHCAPAPQSAAAVVTAAVAAVVAAPAPRTSEPKVEIDVPPDAQPATDVTPCALVLDADQTAVCTWRTGEAVVAAAAGSGKSTVAVERAAALVAEGVVPEAILLLTFNRDAARSLRAKLVARLGETVGRRIRALTYHSYCYAVIRKWAGKVRTLVIGTGDDAPSKHALWSPTAKAMRLGGELDDWIQLDERVRESGIDLDASDAVERVTATRWGGGNATLARQIVEAGRAYARAKAERGEKLHARLLDFSDMLCIVASACRENTTQAQALRVYQHVLVDESQDTNAVQQTVAMYLGAGAVSLQWIGDLRQSIYGFRGAAPSLLTDRVAAGATLLPIRTCRRSTPQIVEAGNRIARGQSWHLGGDSVARPDAPQGPEPQIVQADAAYVADQVLAGIATGGSPADYAALTRVNSHLPQLECACVARGIPCRVLGSSGGVWDSSVGRQIRAYLHAVEGNAPDLGALAGVANRPLRYLKSATLSAAVEDMRRRGGSLATALYARNDRSASRFAGDLVGLTRCTWFERCIEIEKLLHQDLAERAAELDVEPDEDRKGAVSALCAAAQNAGSTAAIEAQVEAARKVSAETPAVTLGTAHRSKGLEWTHVFVLAANGGGHDPREGETTVWPHYRAEDEAEERRLFYTVSSRAVLSLTYVVCGTTPSPYLRLLDDVSSTPESTPEPMSTPESTRAPESTPEPAPQALPPIAGEDPLAGPTPLDADIGRDEIPAPGSRYVLVRLAAMRALLEPLGFRGARASRGNQYLFAHRSASFTTADVRVLVYTTIPVGETVSHEAGEDSIRVAAVWFGTGGKEAAVLPRETWVCRTSGWRDGVLDRIARVEEALAKVVACPDCGSPMRERKGPSGQFLGCVRYPECRRTRPVPRLCREGDGRPTSSAASDLCEKREERCDSDDADDTNDRDPMDEATRCNHVRAAPFAPPDDLKYSLGDSDYEAVRAAEIAARVTHSLASGWGLSTGMLGPMVERAVAAGAHCFLWGAYEKLWNPQFG